MDGLERPVGRLFLGPIRAANVVKRLGYGRTYQKQVAEAVTSGWILRHDVLRRARLGDLFVNQAMDLIARRWFAETGVSVKPGNVTSRLRSNFILSLVAIRLGVLRSDFVPPKNQRRIRGTRYNLKSPADVLEAICAELVNRNDSDELYETQVQLLSERIELVLRDMLQSLFGLDVKTICMTNGNVLLPKALLKRFAAKIGRKVIINAINKAQSRVYLTAKDKKPFKMVVSYQAESPKIPMAALFYLLEQYYAVKA